MLSAIEYLPLVFSFWFLVWLPVLLAGAIALAIGWQLGKLIP